MNKKLNCWEYMLCGREVGGRRVAEHGICPAAADSRFNDIHGGIKAGRTCWVIAGTMCGGTIQGNYKEKSRGCCGSCDFYCIVRQEEGEKLLPTIFLLNVLEDTI